MKLDVPKCTGNLDHFGTGPFRYMTTSAFLSPDFYSEPFGDPNGKIVSLVFVMFTTFILFFDH